MSAARGDPQVGGDHRSGPFVDSGDDLGVVDPAQIPGRDRQVGMPELRWITSSGIPSRDISTACACLSWWGANRRRTPAIAAVWCSWARIPADVHGRPRVGPRTTQNRRPTGNSFLSSNQGSRCDHAHQVHADLAPLVSPSRVMPSVCLCRVSRCRDRPFAPLSAMWSAGPLGVNRTHLPRTLWRHDLKSTAARPQRSTSTGERPRPRNPKPSGGVSSSSQPATGPRH